MIPQGLVVYRDSASYLSVKVSVHDGRPVSGQRSFEICEEQHSSGIGHPPHHHVKVEAPVEVPLGDRFSGLPFVSCEDVRALAV